MEKQAPIEIALSTMEAEYVALSTSCKDLFPLLDLICELSSAVNLPMDKQPSLLEDSSLVE
jgi:hypothetical protein